MLWFKLPLSHRRTFVCVLPHLTGGVREKEHDLFSFHGAWLLFLLSLVASRLCVSPHCALAMKWSRIVKGLVALTFVFISFSQRICTD